MLFTVLIFVPLTSKLCLLLKVLQSALLNAPLFTALAVGTFNVITGVVVELITVLLKFVPVVPMVNADTLVTVPLPPPPPPVATVSKCTQAAIL